MHEWNHAVQRMLGWLEGRLTDAPTLPEMARALGYSPYYCSAKFHEITGMTLKSYLAARRLTCAALELRDTGRRILDIALEYGFSSQEAFTRAFAAAYGCTPHAYRRRPRPIVLTMPQVVLFPEHCIEKGVNGMSGNLRQAHVRVEYIPAHRYLGIWDDKAENYGQFWETRNCDEICGLIESLRHVSHPVVGCHMAGWINRNGARGYFYGLGVPEDYSGDIPEGFSARAIPASYYLVFFHPPFDYLTENGEAMGRVEELAWSFEPKTKGFLWNEEVCPDYQRHYPEVLGYEVLRPVKRIQG